MRLLTILSVFAFMFVLNTSAQTQTTAKKNYNSLIQFSGIVVDQDSLTPIPFVAVMIKGTNWGTKSDYNGFFNLVVSPGDEIEFMSLVHKSRSYKIADTLKAKYYYAIQVLTKDTIQLDAVDVFPWPSKEDFKRAFLALDLSETDMERADKNLTRDELTYLERTTTASSSENYKYVMQAIYTKVYTAGQSPSISLLNPVKWAQFVDAWRKGKYSNKNQKKK
ncbi:MAG: carboxypeptidase-like regulatory domain-containing protein [Bacteroidia bacterium]|nr:carboxypeptidase-like regulatory domain-containing protein [Bacteroidia bacterium]